MYYEFLRFPGGKPKAVTLSYDDGCRDDIKFSETINRYGLKGTFNINSGFIAKTQNERCLTAEEMKKYIIDTGNEIAVHGEFHRAPGKQRPIEGIKDVLNCRIKLEQLFGTIIRGMAYPDSGIHDFQNNANYECVREYLKDLGIAYARSLCGDNDGFKLPADWYNWIPTAHHNNKNIFAYIDKFNNRVLTDDTYISNREPWLFYLWGHSFEFRHADNWDHLEEICQKLSGKDDVWYATNIEIYDYVNAYYSLIHSADGNVIFNPTIYDIWIEIDRKTYCVKSAETLVISKI